MFISILLIFITVAIDQFTKWYTVNFVPLNQSRPFLGGFMDLYHIRNYGASWGILQGQINFFLIISVIVIIYLLSLMLRKKALSPLSSIWQALILAGTVGNFIDRVRLGYVIDMFQLKWIHFPVFNVADMALTIGVILLIIEIIFFEER